MPQAESGDRDLETSVCGWLREPWAFWTFRQVAGLPDRSRVSDLVGVERISFNTADGRALGGYRLLAEAPRGYVLVAQGNAMLADQIMHPLAFFRDAGWDVYVYDYRGYGLSEGKTRLKALVADYRAIVADLNTRGYKKRLLYGMSMGGIILVDAVGGSGAYDALVIDASPSRVSDLGCPETYDPIHNLPADASRLMLIMGERDRVVPPAQSGDMAALLTQRGGRVWLVPEFAHPLQDLDPTIRRKRFQAVIDFFRR